MSKLVEVLETVENLPLIIHDSPGSAHGLEVRWCLQVFPHAMWCRLLSGVQYHKALGIRCGVVKFFFLSPLVWEVLPCDAKPRYSKAVHEGCVHVLFGI